MKNNNHLKGRPRDGFIYTADSGLDVDAIREFLDSEAQWGDSVLAQGIKSQERRSTECHLVPTYFQGGHQATISNYLKDITKCTTDHLRTYLKPYKAFCEVTRDEGWRCLRYDKKGHYKPHSDGDTGTLNRRVSVLIYLNDNYEGGELVFPFQKITIKPKKGMIALFPSGFTHVHSSEPIKKGVKYALVSWLS